MAPTGSSICQRRSRMITALVTIKPAISPIRTAAAGDTKAQGAVIATRPPSRPLQARGISGFLFLDHSYIRAVMAPDADASIVFTAIVATRASVAARVDPVLKPNQPKANTNVPI